MGKIKNHPPVKIIVAFIFKEEALLEKAKSILKKRFGIIDFESEILRFAHTDYYHDEFGDSLKRAFISFKRLVPAKNMYKIKILSDKLEQRFSKGSKRTINIDPGFLDLAKLILFSTKDYIHRIPLNSGIYAEVTLFFEGKAFKPWEWTYPDYKTPEYIEIFNQIRRIYSEQI